MANPLYEFSKKVVNLTKRPAEEDEAIRQGIYTISGQRWANEKGNQIGKALAKKISPGARDAGYRAIHRVAKFMDPARAESTESTEIEPIEMDRLQRLTNQAIKNASVRKPPAAQVALPVESYVDREKPAPLPRESYVDKEPARALPRESYTDREPGITYPRESYVDREPVVEKNAVIVSPKGEAILGLAGSKATVSRQVPVVSAVKKKTEEAIDETIHRAADTWRAVTGKANLSK